MNTFPLLLPELRGPEKISTATLFMYKISNKSRNTVSECLLEEMYVTSVGILLRVRPNVNSVVIAISNGNMLKYRESRVM